MPSRASSLASSDICIHPHLGSVSVGVGVGEEDHVGILSRGPRGWQTMVDARRPRWRRRPSRFAEGAREWSQGIAQHLGIPVQRVNELVRGKRRVTPATAWLLSQALETTPGFWMSLQANYDLYRARPEINVRPIAQAS